MSNVRLRLMVEACAAVASMAAFVLTVIRRDWIEILSGANPDRHSGATEWLILGVFVAVAVIATALAGADWRRMRSAAPVGAA